MRGVVTAAAIAALSVAGPLPSLAQDVEALREAIEDAGPLPADPETGPLPSIAQDAEALPVDPEAPVPAEELLTEVELDDLVAPVALYPDALLAQVLVAATYPLDVAKAERFLADNAGLSEDELVDAIDTQAWDPSVKVLASGFPTVIQRMSDELEWTEGLGLAMLQQDDDVLAAVQRMRLRAEETGYLASNEAQVVETEGDQITIAPADPEVIYVPAYDSAAAFTTAPTAPLVIVPQQDRFTMNDALITGGIAFGTALLVNELFDDDDDDDNGWKDYWNRPRPIHWREREFYPRPVWNARRADERAYLREARWQAELERERAARERWALRRAEQRRLDAERRQDRREAERVRERREDAREAARRAQRERERQEAAQRERREKARQAQRERERQEAARQEDQRKAAQEQERRRAAARAEERREAARQEQRRAAREQARREAARAEERQRGAEAEAARAAEEQKAKAAEAEERQRRRNRRACDPDEDPTCRR